MNVLQAETIAVYLFNDIIISKPMFQKILKMAMLGLLIIPATFLLLSTYAALMGAFIGVFFVDLVRFFYKTKNQEKKGLAPENKKQISIIAS